MPSAAAGVVLALAVAGFIAMARQLRRERARGSALRAALEARVWQERVLEDADAESAQRDARRLRHEANNALSTALLSAQLLEDASRGPAAPPPPELRALAEMMVEALQRLKLLIERGRASATTAGAESPLVDAIELAPLLDTALARVRARFPAVVFEREADGAPIGLRVAACGGQPGLVRALAALLENAAQGDGTRGAGRVRLRVAVQSELDVVALEVSDDGPGFSAAELSAPVEAFASRKRRALGVGLYTAERIARGSGGSLSRANGERGGAVVRLFLPLAGAQSSVAEARSLQ